MTSTIPHLLVAACLVGSVAACGGDDDTDTASSASNAPATDTSEMTDGTGTATAPATASEGITPGSEETVRWGTSTLPTSFDPATVGSPAHIVYMGLVYDTLVDGDANGNLQPGLATEWTLADDAMSLEFTLRDGVTFQDGTPFDADAVVANFEHLMADDSLLADTLGMIDTVEAVETTHVRIVTNRPGGDLPQVLSGYPGMMVSPASLEAGTTSTDPVGAGPFTVGHVTDAGVNFEFWDGYWAAETIVPRAVEVSIFTDDSARLNALQSGQVDVAIIRPSQLAEAEAAGLLTHSVPAASSYGIDVNAATPALADADVRRAIAMAIDRESINEFLYDGKCGVSAQPYPPEHWAHSDDIDEDPYLAYDPDAARAAIDDAAPDGMSLTILTPNVTAYQRLSEVLQEQLAEVGIDAAVEAVDLADLVARVRSGDYDLQVTLMTAASPDPSTWAEENYRLGPGAEEFIDPELPELIEASRTSLDNDVRGEAVGQSTATALEAGTSRIVVCLPANTFATGANVDGFAVNDPRAISVG